MKYDKSRVRAVPEVQNVGPEMKFSKFEKNKAGDISGFGIPRHGASLYMIRIFRY